MHTCDVCKFYLILLWFFINVYIVLNSQEKQANDIFAFFFFPFYIICRLLIINLTPLNYKITEIIMIFILLPLNSLKISINKA